jgi:malto-oligosyltrehalose trehalohydrolase
MDDHSDRRPPLRRRHQMPFGAQLTAAGAVRFRLWAPAAARVELVLYEADVPQVEPLAPLADGWFGLETAAARPGSRYRYRIDGGREVPDPASRSNPDGVHGASEVIDPLAYLWHDGGWRAPPWHTAVIYELHVGTFSAPGTFAATAARLAHLARLGVTAIELMPVAAFPGTRDWGYDGVLPFAPQACYGRPAELKGLIAAAHAHGLAVILDVVYNHFGPEGNYLHLYAPQFFDERHATPWGAAINFDGPQCRTVRDFFIHNARYWLEEYHCDGLRLDAVHAVYDASRPHIVTELAGAARAAAGDDRTIYLTLENDHNAAHFLGAAAGAAASCDAQWNDDVHHCLHVLLSGETYGYYADYAAEPHALLCRALAEGFAYQGELSRYRGAPRGEPSGALPPSAFVNFLQNHDQIGNRAHGERLTRLVREPAALRAAAALLLLAPAPPLLFMGEEWGAREPFPWFCEFEPQLLARVRQHRERESPGSPDPGAAATWAAARLDWARLRAAPHARVLTEYRRLLAIRRRDIAPLLAGLSAGRATRAGDSTAFAVDWTARHGILHLLANLGDRPAPLPARPAGRVLFATHPGIRATLARGELAPWSVLWLLERHRDGR